MTIKPLVGIWLAFILLLVGAFVFRLPFYGVGAALVGLGIVILLLRGD